MNSVLHSESNISEDASLNIYDHYNMTGLPFSVNENSKGAGMNFKVENGKISIQIKLAGNKKTKIADHANEIINSFVHEGKHYRDYLELGAIGYNEVKESVREIHKINAQKQHESYGKTRPFFRAKINAYEEKYMYDAIIDKNHLK